MKLEAINGMLCLNAHSYFPKVKLVQHTYSCLYGTFLCNNSREREARNIYKRTCSVWSLLRTGNKNFQNYLYIPSTETVSGIECQIHILVALSQQKTDH